MGERSGSGQERGERGSHDPQLPTEEADTPI